MLQKQAGPCPQRAHALVTHAGHAPTSGRAFQRLPSAAHPAVGMAGVTPGPGPGPSEQLPSSPERLLQ